MRTLEEFREITIAQLRDSLHRPNQYGCEGRTADSFFSQIIWQICWINERETDFARLVEGMLRGPMRVYGQFFDQHLSIPIPDRFSSEIASAYAQAAYRVGCYTPEHMLTDQEFDKLKGALDRNFMMADHTMSEIVSRFGEPTLDSLGCQTIVHCYGSYDRNSSWIYFDYSRCYPGTYEWFEDPILRDIRRDKNKMELLPFGAWFRKGIDNADG
ncbi:hypothetical protein Enr13x_60060 [Stieleria neptunia]|uniref:Uncharacterized protein n=1 Tax=Stieleria neptunia TaxID=2527979 RepID=A0A518HZ29_9BACT|nr:hypothetical protein [Stieleria neptunia]QDV46102.1 hypothetical protein Enr13x_60060 [Stieleria neptunia]